MILFNCSCGKRHKFTYPCNGVIDINSMDEVPDDDFAKDVEEERRDGWTNPIVKQTRIEP